MPTVLHYHSFSCYFILSTEHPCSLKPISFLLSVATLSLSFTVPLSLSLSLNHHTNFTVSDFSFYYTVALYHSFICTAIYSLLFDQFHHHLPRLMFTIDHTYDLHSPSSPFIHPVDLLSPSLSNVSFISPFLIFSPNYLTFSCGNALTPQYHQLFSLFPSGVGMQDTCSCLPIRIYLFKILI